jgi:hypothetical protein
VELISGIALGILSLIGAASSKLAADEFKAWLPTMINYLIGWAISLLPEDKRERYAEEWRSHIDETPGDIGKLIVGLGLPPAAWKLSRILPKPRARRIMEFATVMRDAERWSRHLNKIPSRTGIYIFGLVTLPAARKRLRLLEKAHQDQEMFSEVVDLLVRIAAEEPGDPFIGQWAARAEKMWEEGFERGYRAAAAGRDVQSSDLDSAIANQRARRRGAVARRRFPLRTKVQEITLSLFVHTLKVLP